MSITDEDPLLSLETVAHSLGVSLATVRRWVQKGRLKTVLLGRHRVVRSRDLAALKEHGLATSPEK